MLSCYTVFTGCIFLFYARTSLTCLPSSVEPQLSSGLTLSLKTLFSSGDYYPEWVLTLIYRTCPAKVACAQHHWKFSGVCMAPVQKKKKKLTTTKPLTISGLLLYFLSYIPQSALKLGNIIKFLQMGTLIIYPSLFNGPLTGTELESSSPKSHLGPCPSIILPKKWSKF